ncbi:MAG: catabolite repression protein creC, partial [Piptocephalis tieghemiana]
TFTTFHVGRTFVCTDLSKTPKEWRFNFGKAFPTTHAINPYTASPTGLDVILGFSTGDLVWIEPFSDRYHRINKQGVMTSSAVTGIQWLPRSADMFMSSHANGEILIFHKDREDDPHTSSPLSSGTTGKHEDGRDLRYKLPHDSSTPASSFTRRASLVNRPSRQNPVTRWRLGRSPITAFQFSPDGRWLAVTSMDGTLKLIDFVEERLTDVFRGYFGALTCLSWSPDGRYIITGGQDDLVSVWSAKERRLVTRGEGHRSWVSSVAFDPTLCTADRYRFGSVGEDSFLCFWDFSVASLNRAK